MKENRNDMLIGRNPVTEALKSGREMERILEELLSSLKDRERQILRLHFGLEGDRCYSLEEISKMLGVSKERVRQVEKHAMEKLQKMGVGLGLEDFLNG